MFVGGNFLTVHNGSRGGTQNYLASFDADTGVWQSWFRPEVNGAVYSLQASPDGGLFVGGEFSRWNGQSTGGLVKIDPTTGELWPGWVPTVTGGRALVFDMKIEADGQLYVVGEFTAVSSAAGAVAAGGAIRMNPASGAVDGSWTPRLAGGAAWGISRSRTLGVTYLVGQFRSVNGDTSAEGFVGVSDTGAVTVSASIIEENNCAAGNLATCHWMYDVEATEFGNVWVAGIEHSLRVFDEADGYSLIRHHYTACNPELNAICSPGAWFGGDYQEIERVGDRIYASCHCWNDHYSDDKTIIHTEPTGTHSTVDSLAAYDPSSTDRVASFRPYLSGRAGAWAIHGNTSDGCLWATGGFTSSGQPQATSAARDLIRLCDEGGAGPVAQPDPGPPGPASCTATLSGSTMSLEWPKGNGVTKTIIERQVTSGGSFFWRAAPSGDTTTFSEAVPNSTTLYRISFTYYAGQQSAPVICGSGGPPQPATSCVAVATSTDRIEVSWTAGANAANYRVYRSENRGATTEHGSVASTSFVGAATAGRHYTYAVAAVGVNGEASAATPCGSVRMSQGFATG